MLSIRQKLFLRLTYHENSQCEIIMLTDLSCEAESVINKAFSVLTEYYNGKKASSGY